MNRVENALAHATETKALRIGAGILPQSGDMFRELFPGKRAVIIADPTTLRVAGSDVRDSLAAAGVEQDQPHIFTSPDLHAEWEFVEELDAVLQRTDAIPVAVGSGTINDLVKLCSHRNGRRYMVVGTAASMDGYTSFGASITFEGAKQTFSCPAPLGVLADTAIIAAAPKEMTASGYATCSPKSRRVQTGSFRMHWAWSRSTNALSQSSRTDCRMRSAIRKGCARVPSKRSGR